MPALQVTHPVETNAVFVRMAPALRERLPEVASFYVWNKAKNEMRFVFSFNNTKVEVDRFVGHLVCP